MPRPRIPAYKQVAADLRRRIESGELHRGESIPSIVNLADEYHVATGTIQKALALLKREGLIESEPGYGTFISS